ncbi:hypothetical protein ACOQFO_01235 [Ureibacillus sp. MALMAid1270]|uniref:hypothetical protein n=1 Tax=Ureibacillus sp. MALMAid1270 TaxID=3411629 RepID=UPI003BA809AA
MDSIVEEYLSYIGVDYTNDKLNFLDRIVQRHLMVIPFDTITKILGYNNLIKAPTYNSDLKDYLKYIKSTGYGGTCFNLTWALYQLLCKLDYQTSIIHLSEGHFALVVKVENYEFYVDVGFMAPMFKLLPLRSTWKVGFKDTVLWKPIGEGGELRFFSGKYTWSGEFLTLDEFIEHWTKSLNIESKWLNKILVHKWKDRDTQLSLYENSLRIIYKDEIIDQIDNNDERFLDHLNKVLKINPILYFKAIQVRDALRKKEG